MKPTNTPGTPIELVEVGGGASCTDEMYVHGHVSPEVFRSGILDQLYCKVEDNHPFDFPADLMDAEAREWAEKYQTRHIFARWVFAFDDDGDRYRALRTYRTHTGRGSFPVTAGCV